MSRAEPCPIPGCFNFKTRGSIFCREHWRAVPFVVRGIINGLWHTLIRAKQSGDAIGFRSAARNFLDWRNAAIALICEQEDIDVVSR